MARHDGIYLPDHSSPFYSATDYFHYVLSCELEYLRQSVDSIYSNDDIEKQYCRLRVLQENISNFVDKRFDEGPFILRCEGMRYGNMLSDENYNIVAVLDWEWAYIAPKQMFLSPPRWLISRRPMHWAARAPWLDAAQTLFTSQLTQFLEVLNEQEVRRAGTDQSTDTVAKGGRVSHLMEENIEASHLWFHELLLAPSACRDRVLWDQLGYDGVRTSSENNALKLEAQAFVQSARDQSQERANELEQRLQFFGNSDDHILGKISKRGIQDIVDIISSEELT